MNAILDRAKIPHVVDKHRIVKLTDALDSALALLQSRWVPRQVEIDQTAQALEVQSLRSGIRADEQTQIAGSNFPFDLVARHRLELACAPNSRFAGACVNGNGLVGKILS